MVTKRALTATIVILIGVVLILFNAFKREKSRSEQKDQIIYEKEAKIDSVKLKNGQIMYEKVRVEVDRKMILENYSDLGDKLKLADIKNKELQSALSLSQNTSGSGQGRIDTLFVASPSDTVEVTPEYRLSIDEKYFNFSATIYGSGMYDYLYTVSDSLFIANTTSRKNIFSPIEHTVKVINSNPNTSITGVTSLTVKERVPKLVIGPSIGYGVTSSGLSPFIGVTITKPIIRF